MLLKSTNIKEPLIFKKEMSSHVKTPKTVLKKVLVGLVLFSMGALAAYLLPFLIPSSRDLDPWVHHPLLPILVMTVIFVAAYKSTEQWVKKFLEKYLFHKKTFAQMTLMDLAGDLAVNLDLQEAANLVVNTFGEVLQLKTVALLVWDPLQNNFEVASAFGWTHGFQKDPSFGRHAAPQNDPPDGTACSDARAGASEPFLAGGECVGA